MVATLMHAEDWTENDLVRFSRLCACASNSYVLVHSSR